MNRFFNAELVTLLALLGLSTVAFLMFDQWSGDALLKVSVLSAIACGKALLVAFVFMEVGHASISAKALIGAWVILLSVLIVAMPKIAILAEMIRP